MPEFATPQHGNERPGTLFRLLHGGPADYWYGQGYWGELPDERLEAKFGPDHVLHLTPELVGPSSTTNQGINGEGVDLTVAHLEDMRSSSILFHLARHLLYNKFRDPGEEPKLHLFGQLKRITRQRIDGG